MTIKDIEVGSRFGETSKFRVYHGTMIDSRQPVIVKVAKTFEDGDVLAEEAAKFTRMRIFADELKKLEQKAKNKDSGYGLLFANLEASFLEATQDDRRVNVFSIPEIEPEKLIPLPKLRDKLVIDLRTSAWILGRLFKFYSFFELQAEEDDIPFARYPTFLPSDFLIAPREHRLIYYNFSDEEWDVVAFETIKPIVSFISDWCEPKIEDVRSGGEYYIPFFKGDKTATEMHDYLTMLERFKTKGCYSFSNAHKEFYKTIEELWGIEYYPFTYHSSKTTSWHTIKEEK